MKLINSRCYLFKLSGDNMNKNFDELRKLYSEIIYESYSDLDTDQELIIKYRFVIPGLKEFEPTITLNKSMITNKDLNSNLMNAIIFRIGLIELISYYKCVCPKNVVIKAGYLEEEETKWFRKLFYNGLSEFLYMNSIHVSEEDLLTFIIEGEETNLTGITYEGYGNLIPIGGGKDSLVTKELLKGYDNKFFAINPKAEHFMCVGDGELLYVQRAIDKNLIELNKKGYLNGHTPFSALVAFISYLVAYLSNRKYIVLSNEGSANEPTIIGTNVNHQYSKTYEFEQDFYNYTKKYFQIDINYFSMLRPIKEVQIAYLFSKYKNYHKVFRSCNKGSKQTPWVWCLSCPKCLFIYIMLRAFLSITEMTDIFGCNLLDDKTLEKDFLELIGESDTKPFECIGTIDEVKFALNKIILSGDNSYLTNLYKNNYYSDIDIDLSKFYYDNNVIEEYKEILKEALNDAK